MCGTVRGEKPNSEGLWADLGAIRTMIAKLPEFGDADLLRGRHSPGGLRIPSFWKP